MARIDYFVFGYRVLTVPEYYLSQVSSILLRAGITCVITPNGKILIKEKYYRVASLKLKEYDVCSSEVRGVFGFFKNLNNKIAILLALFISSALVLFSYDLVWDVRVDGNVEMTDSAVLRVINENGFGVGELWSKTDRSAIEKSIMKNCDKISWININRRGTVAYVNILENNDSNHSSDKPQMSYANIVSSVDCVIEEITVISGRAAVKVGDTVKKGDPLIYGLLPEEAGGGLCKAEGNVVGRVSDEIRVFVDREYTELVEKKEVITSVDIKIFKFCANIFKNHRNFDNGCDIIKEIDVLKLLDKCVLPIELRIDYAIDGRFVKNNYSDDMLVRVACDRLAIETSIRLKECDLISIKTYGEYTENGYSASNKVVFTSEVGKSIPFEVKNDAALTTSSTKR